MKTRLISLCFLLKYLYEVEVSSGHFVPLEATFFWTPLGLLLLSWVSSKVFKLVYHI